VLPNALELADHAPGHAMAALDTEGSLAQSACKEMRVDPFMDARPSNEAVPQVPPPPGSGSS